MLPISAIATQLAYWIIRQERAKTQQPAMIRLRRGDALMLICLASDEPGTPMLDKDPMLVPRGEAAMSKLLTQIYELEMVLPRQVRIFLHLENLGELEDLEILLAYATAVFKDTMGTVITLQDATQPNLELSDTIPVQFQL